MGRGLAVAKRPPEGAMELIFAAVVLLCILGAIWLAWQISKEVRRQRSDR